MKVLVTGGAGLVGRGIQSVLDAGEDEEWVFVGSKDADLRDRQETMDLFERVKPTHVVHLAAKCGGLFMNMRCPVEMFNENIAINTNVMEACRLTGVKKLVTTLSMCIFPDKVTYPIDETMLHDGICSQGLMGYAMAKRMADIQAQLYNKQYGTNFISLIPTNVFGAYDNYNLQDSHVIPALIHKCYIAKRDGTPLTIMGTGSPLRQFIYSHDIGKIIIWAVRSYADTRPLIVSVPESHEVSIKQAAEAVVKHMDFKGELIFDTTAADGQMKKTANITRLQEAMPGLAFTDFDEAMKTSVQWFIDNYETARK
eukprot:TRINITY_DN33747_c0_g1_i1.p1 TRINITY_DN33747_c0_g1~~TRINITY_DN33747_c0_g1_i1.p1  ORF type:complete len:312 (+),score=64.74 TRINITY_DN33747_c0_g1_i1:43-978(+)